ncbi:MAG: DNA circularization N-terminal domain-containing protein [Marivibrio sp.]|uniref:DNA circularization protein n=1 Tax=Marivibrio sp. TaxID=2039719 RepID=UPI0032EE7377
MSWRDNLQPASFRGAPFKVAGHSSEMGGQRAAVHETPGRDGAYVEGLGAKPHDFTIDAFVLGDDYMAARDRVIEACNEPGDGLLVHPYLGELTVVCNGCRVSESTGEGRMARLSLSFIQQGAKRYPRERADTAAAVGKAADAADAASADSFADGYTVAGEPGYVEADAVEATGDFADVVQTESAGSALSFETAELALSLAEGAVDLVRNPPDLAANVRSFLGGVGNEILNRLGVTAVTGLFDRVTALVDRGSSTASSASTALQGAPGRSRLAANRAAFAGLVRRQAAIELARQAPRAQLKTADEAVQLRDAIGERLDREMEAADDETFRALAGLRSATVKHLNAVAPSLARTARAPVRITTPSLVLAYRLHGDAGREGELVERNRIRHPGFVPGGETLEVLIDG